MAPVNEEDGASAGGRPSDRHEAEGMPRRIREHPRSFGVRLVIELRPAESQHGSFGLIEVVNPEVQVKLHG